MPKLLRTKRLLAAAILTASAAPALTAAPAAAAQTIDIATLQKLVTGLGLEDTGDKSTYVAVSNQGANGYVINFVPSKDGSYLYVFSKWVGIPKDKMPMLPALKMLEYNSTHENVFSVGTEKDDTKSIALEHDISAAAVTPQTMRQVLDSLVASSDETTELWDPEKWSTANATK